MWEGVGREEGMAQHRFSAFTILAGAPLFKKSVAGEILIKEMLEEKQTLYLKVCRKIYCPLIWEYFQIVKFYLLQWFIGVKH